MPTRPIADDPAHWRQRAEEARRIANQMDDPVTKATMLDIARAYEQLASLAEARTASKERE
jgi:hypothetical protein